MDMLLDCVIIGGGPAGMNAALVLARAKKHVILFDDDKPRNAVTQESHGFITRDGIKPSEFKAIAIKDVLKYPTASIQNQRVIDIKNEQNSFLIQTEKNNVYRSRKVILATGLKDVLPRIEGIQDFYGTSLFSCPFCDGWELQNRALVVISEDQHAFHLTKMLSNWSKDLIVCTNGKKILSNEQKEELIMKDIQVIEDEIERLEGENGRLKRIHFKNGKQVSREGGLVTARLEQSSSLAESLGCTLNEYGGVETDPFGRTNIKGVYAGGDITAPSQLIIAAAEGSKAAIRVVSDLIDEDF